MSFPSERGHPLFSKNSGEMLKIGGMSNSPISTPPSSDLNLLHYGLRQPCTTDFIMDSPSAENEEKSENSNVYLHQLKPTNQLETEPIDCGEHENRSFPEDVELPQKSPPGFQDLSQISNVPEHLCGVHMKPEIAKIPATVLKTTSSRLETSEEHENRSSFAEDVEILPKSSSGFHVLSDNWDVPERLCDVHLASEIAKTTSSRLKTSDSLLPKQYVTDELQTVDSLSLYGKSFASMGSVKDVSDEEIQAKQQIKSLSSEINDGEGHVTPKIYEKTFASIRSDQETSLKNQLDLSSLISEEHEMQTNINTDDNHDESFLEICDEQAPKARHVPSLAHIVGMLPEMDPSVNGIVITDEMIEDAPPQELYKDDDLLEYDKLSDSGEVLNEEEPNFTI